MENDRNRLFPIVDQGKEFLDSFDLVANLFPLHGTPTLIQMARMKIEYIQNSRPGSAYLFQRMLLSPRFGILVPAMTLQEGMTFLFMLSGENANQLAEFLAVLSTRYMAGDISLMDEISENSADNSFLIRLARADMDARGAVLDTLDTYYGAGSKRGRVGDLESAESYTSLMERIARQSLIVESFQQKLENMERMTQNVQTMLRAEIESKQVGSI